jgi:hypothetical protein
MFAALWPAYAEAYAKHEFQWIRRTFLLTLKGVVALNVRKRPVFTACSVSYLSAIIT